MSQHPDNRETGYSNVLGLCGTAAGGCSANYGESLGGPLRQHPHSPQDDDCDDGDDDDGDDDHDGDHIVKTKSDDGDDDDFYDDENLERMPQSMLHKVFGQPI